MRRLVGEAWGWARDLVGGRRPSWRSTSVFGMVVALAVAAVFVDGFHTAKLELDEASVWATNGARGVAGRINTLAGQVEVTSQVVGSAVDVMQRGREVLVVDPGKSLTVIDPATGNPAGRSIEIAPDIEVSAGGGSVAFHSTKSGRVWVKPFGELDGVDLKKKRGSKEAAPDSDVVVGPSGAVFAVSAADDSIRHLGGPVGDYRAGELKVEIADDAVESVVVGTTPVILARSSGKLQIADRVVDLSRYGGNPRLQEGPASGDRVLVATPTTLLAVPLVEGEPKVLFEGGSGVPVRPVRAGRCAYGAWMGDPAAGGTALLVRECRGRVEREALDVSAGAEARFRVNGSYVILNELHDGRSFLLRNSTLVVVDNWPDATENRNEDNEDKDKEGDGDDNDCSPSAENAPPVAADDPDLGARPAVATVLDVLANDRDADCDVLAIVGTPTDLAPADAGTLVVIDRGHALQFTARGDFNGTATFTYAVSDGRSKPVSASATITVRPMAENSAPEQVRPAKITVGAHQSVSFNVLSSFSDPDGDALRLDGATLPAGASGTVEAKPDGTVTFTDNGSKGSFPIDLTVSDGRTGAGGTLDVEMVGDPKPIARNDHALGLVDQPVTVEVLANDSGIGGEPPTLAGAESSTPGTSVQTDTVAGLLIFRASAAGTYRVPYKIASGAKQAEAFVRIDISEPVANQPPVAVRDLATVVVGGATVVDLVVNDTDPNLDVLVVTSVGVPPGTGLTVQLLEHRALRITASRLPDAQPVLIDYQVTDGQSSPVSGQVQVQVTTTGRVNQPPTARDDAAVVRAGEVVTVPVLANDLDPDGDPLTVDPKVTINLADGQSAPGVVFATKNAVRFLAGDEPGAFTISYEVTDGISGTKDSALVWVRIAPHGQNQQPVPRNLEARTLAGNPVRIPVPLVGIDPDGDAVTLALGDLPSLGIVELSADPDCACLDYTPSTGKAGTDVFSYTATDPGGLVGTATVRVGIGARPDVNLPPIAVADKVKVKPGGSVAVPVLANDSDPENDPLELLDEKISPANGVSATVEGDRVLVKATEAGVATLTYQVSDGKGTTPGSIIVHVDTEAPPVPPIARDDVAGVPDDRGKPAVVSVLDNDEDPDGSKSDLKVAIDPIGQDVARLVGADVEVKLGDRPRVVAYTVTDRDGLSATAVIRIPPAKVNLPPKLRGGLKPYEVKGGESIAIGLGDVVVDPEGSDVFLVPGGNVRGDHGVASAKDASTIEFKAEADYTGDGAVSFTVTDGESPTDTAGARATLSIPIRIHSETNTPPTMGGVAATVEVAGETTTVDLRTYASDPDEGDLEALKFTGPTAWPAGVSGSLNGSVLELTADKTAQKNTQATLTVTVTDGKSPPVTAAVVVSIVASRKPLATVVDKEVIASSGLEETVDVLEGSQAPEGLEPLKVVAAELDPALGTAVVGSDGSTVVVTPSEEFFGVANVTFTVNDSLGDLDRRVSGTIRVTVKNAPAKPEPPTVAEYGNRFVVLTWEPPLARGGTIDKYELSSDDGSITKECTATTCRLTEADGIENDHTYRFTVRAHNEVVDKNGGWSEPSDLSEKVRPDTRPDPSTVGPTLTYEPSMRSGELEIAWPEAAPSGTPWKNAGSPIEEYEVELSPAPSNTAQLKVGPSVTSFVLTGLEDGVEYRARVRARNGNNKEVNPADGWSEWSPVGNAESPASPPAAPTGVTATRVDDPVASVIKVDWTRPTQINAKELTGYTIVVYEGGGETARIPATQSPSLATYSQLVPAGNLGANYSFRVFATNKAGDGALSAPSPSVLSFTKPAQIGSVSATATARNGEIKLTFSPPASQGKAIDIYRVTASPGGVTFHTYSGDGILMAGLTNGQNYTFTVSACNQGQGRPDYCGNPSPSTAATSPYGPPGAPGVSAAHIGGNTIRLSWSAPAPNGRPIERIEISVNGGGFQNAGALSGSTDRNTGFSATHCIVARAVSGGLTGPNSSQACARAPDPPPPPPSVTKRQGGANPKTSGTCPADTCSYVIAVLRNFPPNSVHSVNCVVSGYIGAGVISTKQVTVDGNGNIDYNTGCYAGNTTVGIYVDGTTYDSGWVNWRR